MSDLTATQLEVAQEFLSDPEGFPKERLGEVQEVIYAMRNVWLEATTAIATAVQMDPRVIDWNALTKQLVEDE
jgi:hypothetical protein